MNYLPSITYLRGLCMLGVIGIHVGSYALSNPMINIHLLGLLEIVTRFTVPAFFFVSAFGLFYHTSVKESFSYRDFLRRRIQVVLYPYILWTLLYMGYQAWMVHSYASLMPHIVGLHLLFGNGMYHLYFLVLLLWFYGCMPIWRWALRHILKAPIAWMTMLFFLQMAVNYASSYHGGCIHFETSWVQYMYEQRLNYWILFYVWIFLLGAVMAERYETMMTWLTEHQVALTVAFTLSLLTMLGSYYYVMAEWGYTRLEAIYTIHQLSPQGLVYTGLGCLFFLWAFTRTVWSPLGDTIWTELGNASYGMYLVHPFVLIFLERGLSMTGWTMTTPVVIGLYISTVILSFGITKGLAQIPGKVRLLLLGK